MKRGNLDTDMNIGECHVRMKADLGDASTNRVLQKIASKPSEARGEAWNTFFTAIRRNQL